MPPGAAGARQVALTAVCASSGAPARTGFFNPLRTTRTLTLEPGWLPSSVRARGVSVTAKVRCVPGCILKRSGGAAVHGVQRGISKSTVPAHARKVQPSFTSAPLFPPVASRPPITWSGLSSVSIGSCLWHFGLAGGCRLRYLTRKPPEKATYRFERQSKASPSGTPISGASPSFFPQM